MSELAAVALNLSLVGVPVVAATAAALALLPGVPGRLRYALAFGGFALAVALPVQWTQRAAPAPPETAVAPAPPTSRSAGFARRPAAESGAAALAALALGLLVPVWAGGALLLLGRDLGAHLRLARERRGWLAVEEPLRRSLGVRAGRAIYFAPVSSPRTHGLLSPVIVLPQGLLPRLAHAEGRALARLVVAHEEAHASWRDPLVHALVRAVRSLLWVAPPLWVAERLVAREREAAADAAALRDEGEDVCAWYASTLVAFARVAQRGSGHGGSTGIAVGLGAAADLEYRVRRILRLSRARVATATAALAVMVASGTALAWVPLAERPARPARVARDARPTTTARGSTAAAGQDPSLPSPALEPMGQEPATGAVTEPVTESAPEPAPGIAPTTAPGIAPGIAAGIDPGVAPLAGAPDPPAAPGAEGAEGANGATVHRHTHVDVDVHREDPHPPVLATSLDRDDGARRRGEPIVVERVRVERIRTVLRSTSGGAGHERVEQDDGRSKHPVALFHRGVTAPIKRLLRSLREAPGDDPARQPTRSP